MATKTKKVEKNIKKSVAVKSAPKAIKIAPQKQKITAKTKSKKNVAKKVSLLRVATPVDNRIIFLTGFPGFLGKHLVTNILKSDHLVRFKLLVQEKFLELANNAVAEISATISDAADHLELIVGDLMIDNLNLNPSMINQITANATEVWHLGAVYDLAIPEKVAWEINVEGTRRILDLCEGMPKLKKLVYFSTCYVAGNRTGLIVEDDLDYGQGFKNFYEQSKFEAETMVRKRMEKVPSIVVRPTIVIGDSNTGETEKFDGPYQLIHMLASLEKDGLAKYAAGFRPPSFGSGKAYLNLVPLDYVIAATLHIASKPSSVGKTFQLCDPDPLTAREFFDEVYRNFGMGNSFGIMPTSMIKMLGKVPMLKKYMGVPEQFLDYTEHYAVFDCQNTMDALADSEIRCPNLRIYLGSIIDYVRRHIGEHGRKAKY